MLHVIDLTRSNVRLWRSEGMTERPRRRMCERCGRQIESKQPDVYLCRLCSRDEQIERERERTKGRQGLRRSRGRDDSRSDIPLDYLADPHNSRTGSNARKPRRSYEERD